MLPCVALSAPLLLLIRPRIWNLIEPKLLEVCDGILSCFLIRLHFFSCFYLLFHILFFFRIYYGTSPLLGSGNTVAVLTLSGPNTLRKTVKKLKFFENAIVMGLVYFTCRGGLPNLTSTGRS